MPQSLTIHEVDEALRTAIRRMQHSSEVGLPACAAAVQALAVLRMAVATPAQPPQPQQYVPLPWSTPPASNPTLR